MHRGWARGARRPDATRFSPAPVSGRAGSPPTPGPYGARRRRVRAAPVSTDRWRDGSTGPAPRTSPPVDPRTRPVAGVWWPAAHTGRPDSGTGHGHEGHRGRTPPQAVRRGHRGRRRVVRRRGGRDLRHPRAQRRGEDHHRRVRGRPAPPRRRRGVRPRPGPAPRPRRPAPGARRAAPGERPARQTHRPRGPGPVRLLLRAPRRSRGADGAAGPGREGRGPLQEPLRRPEAAPGHRAGHGRQPAGRRPGRADHRARPARPPHHLGPGRAGPRPPG